MNRKYVIAGNYGEYEDYAWTDMRKRYLSGEVNANTGEYVYVKDHSVLRGQSEVHGVFIGSYKRRTDLEQICVTIALINKLPYKEIKERAMK